MKAIKTCFSSLILAAMSVGFVSCDPKDENDGPIYMMLDFAKEGIDMSVETDAWDNVYDPRYNNSLNYGGFQFSHEGFNDGYTYFNGFCPSKADYKDDKGSENGYLEYQWSSIVGVGLIKNSPYMVAHWAEYNESESDHSCSITSDRPFSPVGVYISNSAYSYYVMKKGNDFSKAFGKDDYLILHIHGVRNGFPTGTVDVDLAIGSLLLAQWTPVTLTSLGIVDEIYFTMESSDSGQWGINTPTYFCLDGFLFSYADQIN